MRIRKRFNHSLCPYVTSDSQLNPSAIVQQTHLQTTIKSHPHGNPGVKQGQTNSQPSDPPIPPLRPPTNQHVSENPRWVSSTAKDFDGEKDEKSNDTPRSSLGEDPGTEYMPPSGSREVVERWFGGGKVVPLKKPRASRNKVKMKNNEREVKESIGNSTTSNSNGESMQKSEGSGVIMEGSRCSRVNGRGWRCSQQTLVGYSLCEHHLGKGRLRCITKIAPHYHNSNAEMSSQYPLRNEKQENNSYEDDEKNVMMVSKKKKKLGVVKARSLSSLLCQPNSGVVVVDEDTKPGC